jgi:hypothetical protein
MEQIAQQRRDSVRGWMSRWPSWVGRLAAASALLYGVVVLTTAFAGSEHFIGFRFAVWPGAAVLLVGAAAATATIVAGERAVSAPTIAVALWTVAALTVAGSCWVLLSLIELTLTGAVHDWAAFLERLALAGVGALFTATALSWQRRSRGVCVRCGRAHGPGLSGRRYPEPHAAPIAVRRIAYAGCALFLPYLFLHTLGALGVSGIEPDGFRPSWPMIAAGVVGVGLAVFLLLGLVRPWGMVFPRWTLWLAGRRVPRFLPLAPVWLIAPTLALYGTGGLVYAFFTEYGVVSLGGAASVAFGGYGWALGVAAVSYQIRTRPRCV